MRRCEVGETVAVLPIERGVYLVKQWREVVGRYTLEAVAGFIEEGETPEEAASRELREEAGMVAKLERVWEGFVSPGYSTEYMYLFLAWEPRVVGKGEFEVVEVPLEEKVSDMKTALLMLIAREVLRRRGARTR